MMKIAIGLLAALMLCGCRGSSSPSPSRPAASRPDYILTKQPGDGPAATTAPDVNSPDPAARMAAVRALAENRDVASWSEVARLVGDPDVLVSEAAILAVCESRDPQAVAALLDRIPAEPALEEYNYFPERHKVSAMEQVVRALRDQWTVQPLTSGLEHANAMVRAICAESLSARIFAGQTAKAEPVLLALARRIVHESNRHVRYITYFALQRAENGGRDSEKDGDALKFSKPVLDYFEQMVRDRGTPRRDELLGLFFTSLPRARAIALAADLLAEKETEHYAFSLIQEFHNPGDVPALLAALKHPSTETRRTVAALLGFIKDRRSEQAMLEGLDDPAVRDEAVKLVGLFRTRQAVPKLIAIMGDGRMGSASDAARSLGQIADGRAYDALVAVLSNKRADYWARASAAWALSQIGDRRAVPVLLKFVNESSVNIAVAGALGEFGGEEAVDALIKLYEPRTASGLNAAVISALGMTRDPKAIAFLEKRLKIESGSSTDWLVEALEQADPKKLMRAMIPKTLEGSTSERRMAMLTLGRVDEPEAIVTMIRLLADDDREIQFSAEFGLINYGKSKHVRPLLLKALSSKNTRIRAGAVYALAGLRANEAIPKVIEMLTDDDEDVRERASLFMSMLSDTRPPHSLNWQEEQQWWQDWLAKNPAAATTRPE